MFFFRNVYVGRMCKSATLGINQSEMGLWLISSGAKMACVESTAIESDLKDSDSTSVVLFIFLA